MNGNANEYVAIYLNNGNNSQLTNQGQTLIDAATNESTTEQRTVQVYENYELSGERNFGDAIYEISTAEYGTDEAWQDCRNQFITSGGPFLIRGLSYMSLNSGMFGFISGDGGAWYGTSFRPVLAF